MRALRQARGERPKGIKIGFTNRTIWPLYDVHQPIWGTVWDTTCHTLDAGARGHARLDALCQPRLEPEVVLGLRATPRAGDTLEQLFQALDWLAPGFEPCSRTCPIGALPLPIPPPTAACTANCG